MIVQRDINSAYPWACTMLPCLHHGQWYQTINPPKGAYHVGKYRFSHPTGTVLAHFPVRSKVGAISFPRQGMGWYWSPEVDAARLAGARADLIGKAWACEVTCSCKPFDFVPALYDERVRIGKSGRGLVLKLGLNSLYGKLAQSVGAAPYANPIWAGLITSLSRARLIDDYTRVGADRCVMLATDGVFYSLPAPDGYNVGTGLGEWDEVCHADGMFIIQPGLYFVSSELGKPKTRGVPQAAVVAKREEFEGVFGEFIASGVAPRVSVPVRSFTGLRLGMARGKPETVGSWIDGFKNVAFDWRTKRVRRVAYITETGLRTLPHAGGRDLQTVPYPKLIGRHLVDDMDRIDEDDQPDWEQG